MSSKRNFTSVPFTPTHKCAACEQFEQCHNRARTRQINSFQEEKLND